jgi:hypothetical protein
MTLFATSLNWLCSSLAVDDGMGPEQLVLDAADIADAAARLLQDRMEIAKAAKEARDAGADDA